MSSLSKFDKVVLKEMKRYGFDLEIVRNTGSTYDASTSTMTVVEELIPVKGLLFDLTLQSNGSGTYGKTLIEAGDKQLYIQPPAKSEEYHSITASDIVPGTDKIIINGDTYKIVTFKEINPSTADSCLWELYIRK